MQGAVIRYTIGGVTHESGEFGFGDLTAFEAHFNLPSSVLEPQLAPVTNPDGTPQLDEDGEPVMEVVGEYRLAWIGFLVWRDARKKGIVPKDVPFGQSFLDDLESVDMGSVEERPDGDPSSPAA